MASAPAIQVIKQDQATSTIVPAETPHAFTNSGEGRLRQIDIHVSASFSTA